MSKHNYPAGASEDSRAPFNQKDLPEMTKDCTNCGGQDESCEHCEGTGLESMTDEEITNELWLQKESANEDYE